MEETETLYDFDAYNDDLPYWAEVAGKSRLIIPCALDTNDFKFATTSPFAPPPRLRPYGRKWRAQCHMAVGNLGDSG